MTKYLETARSPEAFLVPPTPAPRLKKNSEKISSPYWSLRFWPVQFQSTDTPNKASAATWEQELSAGGLFILFGTEGRKALVTCLLSQHS